MTRAYRTTAVRIAVFVAVAMVVSTADAAPKRSVQFWELAIPDLRWEFDDGFDDNDLTLALPVPIAPWAFGLGHRYESIPGGIPGSSLSLSRPKLVFVPEVFIEPQYQVSDSKLRGVLGARLFAIHAGSGAHVFVEGLGVVGQDGNGGGIGVGAGYGSVVSIAYRRMWAGSAAPNALMFDVRLFVLPLSQPQQTLARLGRYHGPLPP